MGVGYSSCTLPPGPIHYLPVDLYLTLWTYTLPLWTYTLLQDLYHTPRPKPYLWTYTLPLPPTPSDLYPTPSDLYHSPPYPHVDRMADAYENIIFQKLLLRAVNIKLHTTSNNVLVACFLYVFFSYYVSIASFHLLTLGHMCD